MPSCSTHGKRFATCCWTGVWRSAPAKEEKGGGGGGGGHQMPLRGLQIGCLLGIYNISTDCGTEPGVGALLVAGVPPERIRDGDRPYVPRFFSGFRFEYK